MIDFMKRLLSIILTAAVLCGIFCLPSDAAYDSAMEGETFYSDCLLLVSADNGEVIFEKNSHEKLHPASMTKMMSMLKRGYSAGASWAMSNATLYNSIYSLVDSNGRPIFIADPKNENIGYILGKPVIIDDNIADDVILLGNFNYMGYNIPQGIIVETSRESSFKSGLIDYRAMAIADTKPLVDEAFIKLSKAAA